MKKRTRKKPAHASPGPSLRIGRLASNRKLAFIDPRNMMRHSAVLAQSGSGKSFMLGRLVEEIAIKTRARILILDPNSDFIRLKDVDSNIWKDSSLKRWFHPNETINGFPELWRAISIVVVSNRNLPEVKRPVIDWGSLEISEMAAILNIDMNTDSDLYACLRLTRQVAKDTWEDQEENYDIQHFVEQSELIMNFMQTGVGPEVIKDSPLARTLRASIGSEATRRFHDRVVALRQYSIWRSKGDGETDIRDLVGDEAGARVLVIDLQSLEREEERIALSGRLLDSLWRKKRQQHWESVRDYTQPDNRVPTFVVLDEAHNLVPAEKGNPALRSLGAQFTRISAEGRKYGLYLVVSTQRPRKVDSNLTTECDNLFLMRMTNDADLEYAKQMYGFLKPETLNAAKSLATGELLLSGEIGTGTERIHVSPRRTVQGGRGVSKSFWLNSGRTDRDEKES